MMSPYQLEEELHTVEKEVIQSIAENMDLFGVTPSIGLLYGTMYFRDQPMTLDEMCTALQMSKTSMSTGVRQLNEISMVHKTWKKGVRKDLYLPETDWYQTFVQLFSTKWRRALEKNQKAVQTADRQLQELYERADDERLKEKIRSNLNKIQHAKEYYNWLSRLVETMESGEIFELIPKRPLKETNKN